MSDEDFAKLQAELDRIGREYNTPELARKHLQEYGMLDENGDLPEKYRNVYS